MKLSRREFLASAAAVASVRAVSQVATQSGGRRILTLVYDKALGSMRAIDKFVPF
ncbi:Tat pathway signal protein [Cognatiyoonia sp.]|uniref:Tat pathway signal protein n=1 Tax=Cognatiyoonia sp. TaxID=2211652 RepID=UPI003F6955B2